MVKKYWIILTCLAFSVVAARAQSIATFEITLKHRENHLAIPVEIDLDKVTFLPDSVLQLTKVNGKSNSPVASQITHAGKRTLRWNVYPPFDTEKIVFGLIQKKRQTTGQDMEIALADGALKISKENEKFLQYHFETVYPPAGVDSVFRRSGFIHPLWTPRGQELTRINAADHYHHWGLWNPWTRVLFENDTIDFWNLGDRQGTVRFANFISKVEGPVFAEYAALHEHVVLKNGQNKVAINEVQTVRIYNPPANQNYYLMDINIQLNCATNNPVRLLEYRYGGLGMRATEDWTKDNSAVLTSEGKNRKESDGSRARWCMVQGKLRNDFGGLVMMGYPTNYNFPEPLRVWPENSNGRGDVFLNFSPTKNMDWLLEPGKTYSLKYRFIVFNDELSREKAETAWQDYAQPPEIVVRINKQ